MGLSHSLSLHLSLHLLFHLLNRDLKAPLRALKLPTRLLPLTQRVKQRVCWRSSREELEVKPRTQHLIHSQKKLSRPLSISSLVSSCRFRGSCSAARPHRRCSRRWSVIRQCFCSQSVHSPLCPSLLLLSGPLHPGKAQPDARHRCNAPVKTPLF